MSSGASRGEPIGGEDSVVGLGCGSVFLSRTAEQSSDRTLSFFSRLSTALVNAAPPMLPFSLPWWFAAAPIPFPEAEADEVGSIMCGFVVML